MTGNTEETEKFGTDKFGMDGDQMKQVAELFGGKIINETSLNATEADLDSVDKKEGARDKLKALIRSLTHGKPSLPINQGVHTTRGGEPGTGTTSTRISGAGLGATIERVDDIVQRDTPDVHLERDKHRRPGELESNLGSNPGGNMEDYKAQVSFTIQGEGWSAMANIRGQTDDEVKERAKHFVKDLEGYKEQLDGLVASIPDTPEVPSDISEFPIPVCQKCNSEMTDCRRTKRTAKSPDFKCTNRECPAVAWIKEGNRLSWSFTPYVPRRRISPGGF
jgi:hypothetical protein